MYIIYNSKRNVDTPDTVDVWMSRVDEVGPVSLVAQWEPSRNGQKYTAGPLNEAQLIHIQTNIHIHIHTQIHTHTHTKIHRAAWLRVGTQQGWAKIHCIVSQQIHIHKHIKLQIHKITNTQITLVSLVTQWEPSMGKNTMNVYDQV